jgi:hypothetical protein
VRIVLSHPIFGEGLLMSRELCFGESGGLGEEMSGGETGTFRLFRGEVCLRFFAGEGLMVVFRC